MIKLFMDKKVLLVSSILFALLTPFCFVNAIVFENPLEYETFEELVDAIVDFLFYVALALVPLCVLIGAFHILTAGGDPKRVKTGQNFILYAMIGLGVILFSRGFVAVLKSVLGTSPPPPEP